MKKIILFLFYLLFISKINSFLYPLSFIDPNLLTYNFLEQKEISLELKMNYNYKLIQYNYDFSYKDLFYYMFFDFGLVKNVNIGFHIACDGYKKKYIFGGNVKYLYKNFIFYFNYLQGREDLYISNMYSSSIGYTTNIRKTDFGNILLELLFAAHVPGILGIQGSVYWDWYILKNFGVYTNGTFLFGINYGFCYLYNINPGIFYKTKYLKVNFYYNSFDKFIGLGIELGGIK